MHFLLKPQFDGKMIRILKEKHSQKFHRRFDTEQEEDEEEPRILWFSSQWQIFFFLPLLWGLLAAGKQFSFFPLVHNLLPSQWRTKTGMILTLFRKQSFPLSFLPDMNHILDIHPSIHPPHLAPAPNSCSIHYAPLLWVSSGDVGRIQVQLKACVIQS